MTILQKDRITNSLEIDRVLSNLDVTKQREDAARKAAEEQHTTVAKQSEIKLKEHKLEVELETAEAKDEAQVSLLKAQGEIDVAEKRVEVAKFEVNAEKLRQDQADAVEESELNRTIKRLMEEAKADELRAKAVSPQLTGALVALAQTGALNLVAKHLGDLAIIRQQSLGGMFDTMFKGTPVEGMLENLKKLGPGALVGAE